jgi:uncharacterized membrane-anchored protein
MSWFYRLIKKNDTDSTITVDSNVTTLVASGVTTLTIGSAAVSGASATLTGDVVSGGSVYVGGTTTTGLRIEKGTSTPTSPGLDRAVGSIYIWTSTAAATGYLKTATATTGWTSLT